MKTDFPQGYLATPQAGKGPGVLVLHAWWGLNDTFKAFCEKLAGAGYVAFAPDLYHGKVTADIQEAETLSKSLFANHQQARQDILLASQYLKENSIENNEIAVAGFSMGAYFAMYLANADPECVCSAVLFYGGGGNDHSRSRASYLGHFAENDPFEPQAQVQQLEASLKAAGRPVHFYQYAGTGHWFFESDRSDVYHRAAADLAWERTLVFLKETLPPGNEI
ncbi:MAG: dienelactone hydrolase family protein [Anaerolineae bacterium]|nr:dienelactone hydrolase family protein [Anaerolineae bacterium]